mmetsp:Transcript_6858/g.15924  ORF Transcript_6858/g.15924 Transcript_6858/m.15924 type:complete len:207 (-) Transcript_6858:289-909(-)
MGLLSLSVRSRASPSLTACILFAKTSFVWCSVSGSRTGPRAARSRAPPLPLTWLHSAELVVSGILAASAAPLPAATTASREGRCAGAARGTRSRRMSRREEEAAESLLDLEVPPLQCSPSAQEELPDLEQSSFDEGALGDRDELSGLISQECSQRSAGCVSMRPRHNSSPASRRVKLKSMVIVMTMVAAVASPCSPIGSSGDADGA